MKRRMIARQGMGADLRNSVPRLFLTNGGEDGLVVDRARMYRYLIDNDLLREREAEELEDTLTRVARRDRVGVEDLRSRGLIRPLRSIGVTSYQFERMSAVGDAHQSMSIRDLGNRDLVDFNLDQVPVPVNSSQFELDRRQVAAGQTRGEGLDTTNAAEHTRSVIRLEEDTLVNGGDVTIGGNGLPGYTNFTPRHQVTLAGAWDGLSNLQDAVDDVLEMRRVLRDDGFTGPYILYIPSNWDGVIDDDYKANSERTLRERILAIDGVEEAKVLPSLADDNALLVQMTQSVVVMPVGQEITTVTWDLMGGLASRWVVMSVASFALKTAEDESGSSTSGIAHLA